MFDSGVMVVQLQSHSEEEMIASALNNVSFTIANMILSLTLGLTSQTAWPLGHMYMKHLSTEKSGLGFFIPFPITGCLHLSTPQVSDKGSLTAEEFAKLLGLSVLLSKER